MDLWLIIAVTKLSNRVESNRRLKIAISWRYYCQTLGETRQLWSPSESQYFNTTFLSQYFNVTFLSQYFNTTFLSQYFNATYLNNVGRSLLRAFGHHVATCCDMVGVVDSNLKMVKFFNIHRCCMMLYSFGQVRATMVRLSMRTSSIFNTTQQGSQTRATCYAPPCCDMLC